MNTPADMLVPKAIGSSSRPLELYCVRVEIHHACSALLTPDCSAMEGNARVMQVYPRAIEPIFIIIKVEQTSKKRVY
jgi:hypothetical protein